MSESEVRGAAIFYDHELEDGHATRRRRRPAADWGVGEELFEHMPSRRRFRAGDAGALHDGPRHESPRHEAPRRDPHARTRPAADFERPTDELELPSRPAPASVVDAAWMAELTENAMPAPAPRPDPAPEADRAPEPTERDDAPRTERDDAPRAEIDVIGHAAEGRRTVVIRGRGAERASASHRDRRPPRTVGERLGPRPDYVAAWAVALGVLLILIAILTAH